MENNTHKFPYKWTLQDAKFTKDKGKVFSCFACGGGSTMGYKLAGFNHLGGVEIDKKIAPVYQLNHNPKYLYNEDIRAFNNRNDLPKELYELDILDGSPPCSSFSMAGNREKDWGKEKKFREGQSLQVLDTLFFDFIDLAKELQPKIVIAENVKGLLMGNAKSYVREIYKAFDLAGYYVQHFLLDASKMGVPQKRERVFFIALRKDLAKPFLVQKDFFTIVPKLDLKFNEPQIPFKDIQTNELGYKAPKSVKELLQKCNIGDCCSLHHPKKHFTNYHLLDINNPIGTLMAGMQKSKCGYFIPSGSDFFGINKNDAITCQTFPKDYKFGDLDPYYLLGMSVPPVMVAQIATEIYSQWKSIF